MPKILERNVDSDLLKKVKEWLCRNGAGELVRRSDVKQVTDGLVQPGTIRNDDSLGRGPAERILFAGKVAYRTHELAKYMLCRGLTIETREQDVK